MNKFWLRRLEDKTGISGVGIIAEGIEFSNGKCVINWLTEVRSIGIYENINDVEKIHGHKGKTEIVWNNLWMEKDDFIENSNMAE